MALKKLLEDGVDLEVLRQKKSTQKEDAGCQLALQSVTHGDHLEGDAVTSRKMKTTDKDESGKKHPCMKCGKKFRSLSGVRKHSIRRHSGKVGYSCTECARTFKEYELLKKHVLEDHAMLSSQLGDELEYQTTEKKVGNVMDSSKRHKCNLCSKSFSALNRYVMHMVRHNEKRPHSCKLCNKTFKMAGNLAVHEKTCGSGRAHQFQCKECSRLFKYQSQCTAHERIHHSSEKPYPCEFCAKRFRTKQQLKLHDRTHTLVAPYRCEKCDRRFKRPSAFAAHKRQHHDPPSSLPYVCQDCQKGFQVNRHLVEHVRSHTGEKPYPCMHCNKAFALKRTLIVHTRIHTGHRPWVCENCGKRFTTSGRLKEHIRIHTGKLNLDFNPYYIPALYCGRNSWSSTTAGPSHHCHHA